jgi:hypothetical protein
VASRENRPMRRTCFERAKSIAGAALVAVGTFILYQHVDRAAAALGHVSGISGGALGVLPAMIFAASRVVRAYAGDQQRFLRNFLEQALISSWPLVLVTVGAMLSREGIGDEGDSHSKKIMNKRNYEVVDLASGRSTLR